MTDYRAMMETPPADISDEDLAALIDIFDARADRLRAERRVRYEASLRYRVGEIVEVLRYRPRSEFPEWKRAEVREVPHGAGDGYRVSLLRKDGRPSANSTYQREEHWVCGESTPAMRKVPTDG